MRQRIVEYIDQHLTDSLLSPKTIMQHFRLSHSHLYRIFEADKGVAHLIRNKRLDFAYRMILRRQGLKLSLKELAYKSGFSNRSQFSRFFQERFDINPKELCGLQNAIPHDMEPSILFHNYIAARIPAKNAS